ncbi:hypothetical protein J0A67_00240 [Algoriphagus aestuariicola]|jgi:hypothetical protein|uniref:Uncharacterized protein n=1 Tax=Algoriphagus aestuariicola TaxID=1852016 RepID=A0ABS3BIY4_9BACT|nr:hypothetical protein [Algoriphagus aestuariicola]MBN7799262.1 hypothetical protein [Algoriphagus aestuariicola]
MHKALFILPLSLSLATLSFSQTKNDVMHLLEGQKEVQVKEVGFNTIKYSYPNENTVYSVSKHQVTKIEYASGREETFESPFKPVKGLDDAELVYITYNPEDIAGLNPKGELFSKATGVTTLSSINNVKNRALDKLKAEAAMLGANVVFVGNVYQRGNQYGGENQPGNSTQTTFSGTGYSTEALDKEGVRQIITGQKYHHYQTHKLNRNDWNPTREIATVYDKSRKPLMFEFDKIMEKEDGIYVSSSHIPSKTKELKVIRAEEDVVILMERNDKTITNYYLISKENKYFKNMANRVVL